ncbi:uncharacterized protein LOC132266428 isoform X2 [Cornus florida]|uniref:uncharacterized protein LOC132266428 isoform X2 n=1 Tax=Cornus florida TaxID=4283 RepID=UPI00289C9AF3|nr:uncharacterized protein LOC132266428 isoform X2 [Cornus florida]
MPLSSLMDNWKTAPRRSARIAERAGTSRNGSGLTTTTDGHANPPPKLKEMAGVDHDSNNLRVVACSSRRKMKSSTPPFFPEEIIFNILLCLPAEVLYNVMRYVCREWYNVINAPGFINSHLQKLTDDSLIIRSCKSANAWFVAIHNCNTQIRRLRSEFCGGFPRRVLCSCDGLLFLSCDDRKNLYVGNPITKQLLTLPPVSTMYRMFGSPQFTYARSTGRYKAHLPVIENVQSDFLNWLIFTVGTDSAWRSIETKHVPDFFAYTKSFSTGGYIYYTSPVEPHLLALDADAEIFHQYTVPNVFREAIRTNFFEMSTRFNYIVWKSFLAFVAHSAEFVWELWALTELNTGEWTRCFIIDLSGHIGLIEPLFDYRNAVCLKDEYYELPLDLRFIPVTSLKKGELVIFRGVIPFENYLVYNVKTGDVSSFVIGDCYGSSIFERHVNSLVSWKVS